MGIVLKRRDNAPIVKIVVGGIVRAILNNPVKLSSVIYTKDILKAILSCKYNLDKFIISKTIKGNGLTVREQSIERAKPKEQRKYSDRTRIVHAVLADRMAERDPGNKPLSNERIPYAYVITKTEPKLQGDRVEHPDYIKEHNLQLDYLFYITNQIMKPSLQFLEHVIPRSETLFNSCIMKELNRRHGKRPVSYYFNLIQQQINAKDAFDSDDDDSDVEEDIDKEYLAAFSCFNSKPQQVVLKKKTMRKKINVQSNEDIIYDQKHYGFKLDF